MDLDPQPALLATIAPHWSSSYPKYLNQNQTPEEQQSVVWSRLCNHRAIVAKCLTREQERYLAACRELNPRTTQAESSHEPLSRDRLPPQRHGSGQLPMRSSIGHAHALTTDLAPADLAPTQAQHVALGSETWSKFVRTTYNTPLQYRTLGLHMTQMRPPDVCNKSFICVIDCTVFYLSMQVIICMISTSALRLFPDLVADGKYVIDPLSV